MRGFDDDLCFRGGVSRGDASLRFLLYALKRHRRVLGMCDAWHLVESDATVDGLRLGIMGKDANLSLHFLLSGISGDVCVCFVPEERDKATDDLRWLLLPLRALNRFRRLFLRILCIFVFDERGVSNSRRSRLRNFWLTIVSQEALGYCCLP